MQNHYAWVELVKLYDEGAKWLTCVDCDKRDATVRLTGVEIEGRSTVMLLCKECRNWKE